MSDLRQNLLSEFIDPEYRYAYAESFLNTKVAAQIKALREQRGMKQAEVGAIIGTPQSGYSRFEDVNHAVWKTDTLWKIAKALGVRVDISFETFGSLVTEKEHFTKESLQRPSFDDDPAFNESAARTEQNTCISGSSLVAGRMEFLDKSAHIPIRGRHPSPKVSEIFAHRNITRGKRYRNYGRRERTSTAA